MAGTVTLDIDVGAGLGLPSSTALPALALEMGLEAAMLYKILASVTLNRETENKQTNNQIKHLVVETDNMFKPTW